MYPPDETILVNGVPHQINTKRITLITGKELEAGMVIKYPEREIVSSFTAREHLDNLIKNNGQLQNDTDEYFRIVVPNYPDKTKITVDKIKREGTGFQILLASIDLICVYINRGKQFTWKFPESYLHASYQANIADLLIHITK